MTRRRVLDFSVIMGVFVIYIFMAMKSVSVRLFRCLNVKYPQILNMSRKEEIKFHSNIVTFKMYLIMSQMNETLLDYSINEYITIS